MDGMRVTFCGIRYSIPPKPLNVFEFDFHCMIAWLLSWQGPRAVRADKVTSEKAIGKVPI